MLRLSDRAEVQACTCFLQCLQPAISVLQQLVYCPSSQYVFVLDGADLARICNLACSLASNDSSSEHPFVAQWKDVFLCISDRPSAFWARVKPTATSAPSIHPSIHWKPVMLWMNPKWVKTCWLGSVSKMVLAHPFLHSLLLRLVQGEQSLTPIVDWLDSLIGPVVCYRYSPPICSSSFSFMGGVRRK
jgi:hypothetical protein